MCPRPCLVLLTSALLTVAAASTVPAQTAAQPDPDAIQEDWSLVVGNPAPLEVGPQITTVMSPVGDPSAPFVAFDLNYREYPYYAPGGMQLQVWSSGRV